MKPVHFQPGLSLPGAPHTQLSSFLIVANSLNLTNFRPHGLTQPVYPAGEPDCVPQLHLDLLRLSLELRAPVQGGLKVGLLVLLQPADVAAVAALLVRVVVALEEKMSIFLNNSFRKRLRKSLLEINC